MNILSNIGGFFSNLGSRTTQNFLSTVGFHRSPVIKVQFDRAMAVPAFWASVKLLCDAVAGMPLKCYEKVETPGNVSAGFKEVTDNEVWRLLNFAPNRYQTRVEFFLTVMLNLTTDGNAYCAVQRNSDGDVLSIIPLMSPAVTVELLSDGEIIYKHRDSKGNIRVFASQTIWHLKLFGNGIVGLSPLSYAGETLGIAVPTQERQAKLARSGGKTNGILMVDSVLDDKKRAAIRENFSQLTEGSEDQLFVLEAAMKFERAALSPSDAQLLETYKFQVQEIARMMGVPSILINDSNVTAWGSGIQQIMEGFYKLGLRPYLENIEASIKRHLLPEEDWDKIFIEFDFESLLRSSLKDRVESFSKAINSGQMTPNEARAEEGRAPIDGGDVLALNGGLEPVTFFQQPEEGATVSNNGTN